MYTGFSRALITCIRTTTVTLTSDAIKNDTTPKAKLYVVKLQTQ